MTYFIELLCDTCKGKGCASCNNTGAVEHQVTASAFYGVILA